MTMPASSTAAAATVANNGINSAAQPPKKHRQTRLPEHLKTIKKGSSSSSNTLKSNIARALRANSPSRKSESSSGSGSERGSSTISQATTSNGKTATKPATSHRMDDVINAQLPFSSASYAASEQWPHASLNNANTANYTLTTSPYAATSNAMTRPSISTSHQASLHSNNGGSATSSPSSARLPYAFTNDRANELAAAAAGASATNNLVERSISYQGYPQQPQGRTISSSSVVANASSRPSTSTSTMAQDSTLLARSCSSSASSMAYSQPDFTFSVVPNTSTMSSSSHSLLGNSSSSSSLAPSVFAQPYMDSSSLSSSTSSLPYQQAQQMPLWNMGTNAYGQAASPTTTSAPAVVAMTQPSHPYPVKTPTRTKRSGTTLSAMSGSSASAVSVHSSSTSSSKRNGSVSSSSPHNKKKNNISGTSPSASPSTPFSSASLVLSVSSNGKACLTTPKLGNSQQQKSPARTASNALAAAAMMRSSTTNAVKTPSRPSMMRSITTDPRMSSSMNMSTSSSTSNAKREVSELNGVGRVVGQGKMFDLHSNNKQVASLPQSLNLDIEMDLAAGMGGGSVYNNGQIPTSTYSQIAYPYAAFPPNASILTPPQSAEIVKQSLPLTNNSAYSAGKPFYPEKERFQSSWKFPAGMGLNLHSASGQSASTNNAQAMTPNSARSSPSSSLQSSFPSMHSLNASIVNVAKGGDISNGGLVNSPPIVKSPAQYNTAPGIASEDMSRRQSRIQAWLDSPDLQDGDETITPASSSWSSLPSRTSDMDMGSAPPTASSSSTSLGGTFSISPASIMTRTSSEMFTSSSITPAIAEEEYEDFEVMRASGKSVRPLKMSKKRRLANGDGDEEDGSLSMKDRDAIKAGLGMPFQVSSVASRQVTPTPDGASPGKRNKLARDDDTSAQSSPNKTGAADGKGKRGRKNKKKGSNKCFCGTGDDGEAMIQCDDCRSWSHLACVGVDEEQIPETWLCSACLTAAASAAKDAEEQAVLAGAISYPSPTSPVRAQLAPSAAIQQTPKRPGLTREPTFSKTATPKAESARHFDDAPLVAAPTVRPVAIPSTPQSANASHYTPGHTHNASLSRAYAPVTPRVGFSSTGQSSSGPATNYQWDTYSPHTPSNAIAHSRRLSRQNLATPSTNWSQFSSSHWEELPSSQPRRGDESEKTKQWEQFYNAPPPASINPIPMTPPLASHPAFPASEGFLPPFEQEASVSQRFLAIHSTPSNWTDTSRFPNNVW